MSSVIKKTIRCAVGIALSLFLPGLGTYMAGKRRRGFVWFALLMFMTCASIMSSMLSLPYVFIGASVLFVTLYIVMVLDSAREPAKHTIHGWLIALTSCCVFTLLWIAISQYYAPLTVTVTSDCMVPTLVPFKRERIVVDLCTYHFCQPCRGDIVLVRSHAITNCSSILQHPVFLKRIVGLPNEHVAISDRYVYINGNRLEDPSIFRRISEHSLYKGYCSTIFISGTRTNVAACLNGPLQYYLLGDNSEKSLDSRYFGPLHREDIIGRVAFVVWPPHCIRTLE